ncbi:hypothetical protein U1Q18_018503 [Sarracenia purpurea var. burkii]
MMGVVIPLEVAMATVPSEAFSVRANDINIAEFVRSGRGVQRKGFGKGKFSAELGKRLFMVLFSSNRGILWGGYGGESPPQAMEFSNLRNSITKSPSLRMRGEDLDFPVVNLL